MKAKLSVINPKINFDMRKSIFDDIITDALKVAENAAMSCYDWIGRGEEKLADKAAVEAMRNSLNQMSIFGEIVIGEGERDEAPMLYIGEKVGNLNNDFQTSDQDRFDIALDPLEGTTICAHGKEGSLAVIAFAKKDSLLHAPDVYMDKIAVGSNLPNGVVDLDNTIKENLTNLADAKNCKISDLTVMVLKRERHEKVISQIREAGAKIRLIDDGDVAAVISTASDISSEKIDLYVGIGGAPEGVLAACALKSLGGQMQGRLIFGENDKQIQRAKKMGIVDLNKKYNIADLAKGDALFIASGVTDGKMLKGVKKENGKIIINSLVLDSSGGKVQMINTIINS